jgi:4-amino-4-deoxy-L-arabinose transferase-like glycosyltransferase
MASSATQPAAAPSPGGSAPGGGRAAPGLLPLFLLSVLVVWTALPALLQTVPHADNIEQLDWAHSLQWGYFKHPPLPTWLLYAATRWFEPSALLTYALAMGCVVATLALLWQCARLFLDRQACVIAVLISSADYYLMGRGSFLNHNTVMLPFVAASAWAVLRIVRDGAAAGWPVWALLGLAQALGMLTKYQMAVIIGANALCLLACGAWRQSGFPRKVLVCALATGLPLLPHLRWLQQHEFSTFAYAGHSLMAGLAGFERLRHTLGFFVQQLGRLAPAAIALGIALALARRRRRAGAVIPAPAQPGAADGAAPRWAVRALFVLALTPLGTVLALALLAGVAPQNHWGASTTLLLPLLAVCAMGPARLPPLRITLAAVCLVHLLAVAWNVVAARRSSEFHYTFAARPLAAQAQAHWQAHGAGALGLVIGPDWEAGSLALEMPTHPDVLGSGERNQAPWVDDARIERCGALVLWRPGQPIEAQVGPDFARRTQFPVRLHADGPQGSQSALEAGILVPSGAGCPAPNAR